MTRRRLDAELVRRGLVASTSEAREVVRAGLVRVGGVPATKTTTLVADDAAVHVETSERRFVSRGGDKLDAALARSGIDPRGHPCLDAGASTGGFTDRLLQGGAASVVAVDVGYGQLDWRLRSDPRVTVLERTNIRDLRPDMLETAPNVVAADLSFVSLRSALPHLVEVAAPGAALVVLVKPQFEADPSEVGAGGVVRDPAVRRRCLERVIETARGLGTGALGAMASPVRGPAGNVEYLVWGHRDAPDVEPDIEGAIAEGEALP